MPAVRIFLIGFEPPGWNFGVLSDNGPMQSKLMKLMDGADAASVMPDGWPVGDVMDMEGVAFLCTEHEHDGKIVIVRPMSKGGTD